jgi:hypothetical protein
MDAVTTAAAIEPPRGNAKRTYALQGHTVESRPRGWFYRKTYQDDDWHGPYSSEHSVCLMIARSLRKELMRRDSIHKLPE